MAAAATIATAGAAWGPRKASSKGSRDVETARRVRPLVKGRPETQGTQAHLVGSQVRRGSEQGGALTHVKEVSGCTAIDNRSGGPSPTPCLPGLVQVLDIDIGRVVEELSAYEETGGF